MPEGSYGLSWGHLKVGCAQKTSEESFKGEIILSWTNHFHRIFMIQSTSGSSPSSSWMMELRIMSLWLSPVNVQKNVFSEAYVLDFALQVNIDT